MPAAGSRFHGSIRGRRSWCNTTQPTADLAPATAVKKIQDERLREVSLRHEDHAAAGTRRRWPVSILVTIFFLSTADASMFTLAGIMNILAPASQLGILAIAAALLMIGGEFDLSIGSMVAFTGLDLRRLPHCSSGWPLLRRHRSRPSSSAAVLGGINGQIVIRTRLPSFIVTLAFLFILRGLSLVGLKWATGGSTQMRGIGEQAGEGIVRELFSGVAFEGLFAWLAGARHHRQVPERHADGDGHAGLDRLVHSASPLSPPGSCCARAPATGSSPPAAMPMRRAIPACRSTG